jgi:hypothetical protein
MKRIFFLLLIVCMIGFPALTPAFEGTVLQKNTHVPSGVNPAMEAMEKMLQQMPPDQRKMVQERMKAAMGNSNTEPKVSTQTIYIKGPNMRMDFDRAEGEKTFMIMDVKKRLVRNCFPDRKAYLEMKFDDVEQMGKGLSDMRKGLGAEKQVEKIGALKKTEEKKEINGYMCELYTQQVGDQINEYWITKAFTMKQIMGEFADHMASFGKSDLQGAQQETLMKIDGYPILTVTRNKYGTNHNEVMKIEKKGLSNDLFAIPAGYQKQSMRDMMNR